MLVEARKATIAALADTQTKLDLKEHMFSALVDAAVPAFCLFYMHKSIQTRVVTDTQCTQVLAGIKLQWQQHAK